MKSTEFKMRVSPEELAVWREEAAAAGLKLSEWARRKLNDAVGEVLP